MTVFSTVKSRACSGLALICGVKSGASAPAKRPDGDGSTCRKWSTSDKRTCERETMQRRGTSSDFALAVKHGRDARDLR
jgi:hypothetical protein